MKPLSKFISIILCLMSLCGLLSGCGFSQDDLDEAWENGREYGYEFGYDAGFDDGIEFCEDLEDDYDTGYDTGYDDGHNDGYYAGYYAGATYVCLSNGDVNRAFKCAYIGSAWHTFIDCYDEYIFDIYDDDETRSNLFWALVSVESGDGVTEEERDLLISTFGEVLFIDNCIDLEIR